MVGGLKDWGKEECKSQKRKKGEKTPGGGWLISSSITKTKKAAFTTRKPGGVIDIGERNSKGEVRKEKEKKKGGARKVFGGRC